MQMGSGSMAPTELALAALPSSSPGSEASAPAMEAVSKARDLLIDATKTLPPGLAAIVGEVVTRLEDEILNEEMA